jgi:AraC family transcriptional regulator of adaptative response / DNA-3-methyladenine glycosylase II
MIEDFERCYSAVESRDQRFDGVIYIGVTTTGIYCRPSCPANMPKRRNVQFFATAAGAQAAGFRACRRCRPEAAPGSPEWDARADVVGRAMRLIADGVVDREGVAGLARRLGYSERHIHRQLVAEVGVGPLALARAHRAQTARMLIDGTRLSMSDVAFASGFASVRQFNDDIRSVFAATPMQLRSRRTEAPMNGGISLRLAFRRPYAVDHALGFLSSRCVPGIEEVVNGVYRRTVRLPHGHGVPELAPAVDHFVCRARLQDVRDVGVLVQRCRSFLDLDSDPIAIDDVLRRDPALRGALKRGPGSRVIGTLDAHELALRAVLGQQVSVKAAVTAAARLVELCGTQLEAPSGGLTHLFPTAQTIAGADLTTLKMPAARRAALARMAEKLASEELTLDAGVDRERAYEDLLALPGVGRWTASYIAMRALNDPDAFVPSDLGARRGAAALGLPVASSALDDYSARWRPWRAYALQYLWASA